MTMTEKAKTILIGCFIIIACLATIGVLLFLRPTVGDGKKKLLVCFTSIDKVQVGTRVTFAGKPVGEVVSIREIYDARNQPTGRYGHICFYELELAIDSSTVVYNTDEVTVHTTGLLGERTIAIIPRPVPKGKPSFPITDQVMYGKSGDPVEETLNQIISIGSKASQAIDQINELLANNKAEIGLAITAIKEAALEVESGFREIHEEHLIDTIKEAFVNLASTAKHADAIVSEWQQGKVGGNISTLAQNLVDLTNPLLGEDSLQKTFRNIAAITESLRADWPKVEAILTNVDVAAYNIANFSTSMSPEGTVGRLFKKDEFYLKLMSILTKGDILLNDINNYGLLFNQDKTWQRERMRELKILSRLDNPQAFQNFFACQTQSIWLALNRLGMVLKQAQGNSCGSSVVLQPQFKEEFNQLIDQMDRMEETLKLYRESLFLREDCRQRAEVGLPPAICQ